MAATFGMSWCKEPSGAEVQGREENSTPTPAVVAEAAVNRVNSYSYRS